ncbi:MAG TPA: NlpC/P60 family protein [Jatrophihabitans sp.]|nr:NlpC/P60 family protein [Jatrophihabitans sp.]
MSRAMRMISPIALVGALIASLVLVGPPAGATPDTKPTIESVRKQLDVLARKNSQIVDKYDGARIRLEQRTAAAATAARRSALAKQQYTDTRRELVRVIQAQYMGSDLGAAGALLDSDSTGNYLDRLDLLNLVSIQTAEVVKNANHTRSAAAKAAGTAATLLDAAKAERAAIAKQRTAVDKQIAKYKALLATLTAEQQAAYERAQAARAAEVQALTQTDQTGQTHQAATSTRHKSAKKTSNPASQIVITGAPSKKALIAVQFALAQVGKPYVYAADGPGAYDCSGLTMASWRAAGVHLPHQASAQYNRGHHVTLSQLLPGDLVFYYQPIGHVSIYIGNGLLVSAPQPGQSVEIVKLKYTLGDFTGATRVG